MQQFSNTMYCRAVLAFVIYFVVGAIIKKVQYNATGTDIVPNKDFWVLLPVLLKV